MSWSMFAAEQKREPVNEALCYGWTREWWLPPPSVALASPLREQRQKGERPKIIFDFYGRADARRRNGGIAPQTNLSIEV